MKKRLMVLAMAGIMVTGLVSSANIVSADDKEASGLEGKRIGVCLVYKGDEWCAAVADEFEKQAKDLGVDVNIQDGNLDAETQTKQIENYIAQEYDLIAVDLQMLMASSLYFRKQQMQEYRLCSLIIMLITKILFLM